MKLHIKSTACSQLADKLRDRTMIRCAFFAKKTGVNSKIKTKDTYKQEESERRYKWMPLPPKFTRVTSYTLRSRNRDLWPE